MNEKETKTTARNATQTGLGPCGRALQRHLGLRKDKEIGPGLQHGQGQGRGLGRGMARGLGLGQRKGQGLGQGRGRNR